MTERDVSQARPVLHVGTLSVAGLGPFLWRHGEAVLFWTLAALHLIPIWTFRYLPTQDGPSHLNNAQILKACLTSASSYDQFFEIRSEPVPNWTSHVLLAAMYYVVPPLVAEKLLVSLYVLGFAGSLRYFLGAFGDRCRPFSWLGLLFLFNHCFWMGFYNYCLSVILVWLIMGYCLRRGGPRHLAQVPVLMLLFVAAYFTHLAGWLVAFLGALSAGLWVKPRSFLGPVLVCLAALPAGLLTMDYFEHTGFFRAGPVMRITHHPLDFLRGKQINAPMDKQWTRLDQELFEHHAAGTSLGLFVVAFALGTVGFAVLELCLCGKQKNTAPSWLFPALLGLVLLGLFMSLPDDFGAGGGVLPNGGFIKGRLAVLVPLLLLACLREPAHAPPARYLLRALTVVLLAVNLVLVMQTMRQGNRILEQYTAGIEAVGRGHRLIEYAGSRQGRMVNIFSHALDYYCLGTDNICLENYEADTPHFPIKHRAGLTRGRAHNGGDVVVCWRAFPGPGDRNWQEIFAQGPLRIFRAVNVPPP